MCPVDDKYEDDELSHPKLFDDFERSDAEVIRYDETSFEFWNRSAWKIAHNTRQRLESWFSRYPVEFAHKLRSDLRRPKATNGLHGAYFELFLHELLHRLGCQVTVNPKTKIGTGILTPDFLVEHEGRRCYVEATQVDYGKGENRNEEKFMQDLNRYPLPGWYAHLSPRGKLDQTLNQDQVKKVIDYASSLDVTRRGASITVRSPDGKWQGRIDFTPLPPLSKKKSLDRWLMGKLMGGRVDTLGIIEKFKSRITGKASRYHGKLDAPLVIALWDNQGTIGGHEWNDDAQILFGDNQNRSGLWMDRNKPQYLDIAGVWVFRRLYVPSLLETVGYLYPNPLSNDPIPAALWDIGYAEYADTEIAQWIDGQWLGGLMMTEQERHDLTSRTYPPATYP